MFGKGTKKVNQTGLENIRKKFLAVNLASIKSEKVLSDLRHLYSECNWKTFDDDFRKIDQVEIKRKISLAETEYEKRIFTQKKVSALIQSLEDEINQTLIVLNNINQLPVTILKAQANVYDLLDSIDKVYTEMESTMSRIETSSNKVKKMYESAKDNFNQNKKLFDSLKSEEVDWVKFSNLFIKSHNLMRMARDGVKTAEEFMNRKLALKQS